MANKAIQEMIKATVPQYVHEVIHFLKHGMHGSVYLVGGCVRDMFRGIKPMDYDLATDLTPDTIIDYFTSHYRNSDLSAMQWSVVDTGSKYGTVTIVCKFYGRAGESSGGLGRLRPATIDLNNLLATHHVEVTTFRTDGKYSDGRRPDEVTFGSSLNLDLARRDFTMNAMAIDPINFELIDPYNGQADIKVKNIRAVGDPNERIQEDALRMLRAVRFAARLGFYLYPSLCDAIKHNAHLIANVSPERVQSELVKMLLSCEPGIAMSLLKELGLMNFIIPELVPTFGFDHHNPHHLYDVWQHTVGVVDIVPDEIHMKLAALFHDIGKPKTFELDKNGIGHFYGHEQVSAEIASYIMQRLKFSNAIIDKTLAIINNHMCFITNETRDSRIRRALSEHGYETLIDLMEFRKADRIASGTEQPKVMEMLYDEIKARIATIMESPDVAIMIKDLAIRGGEILKYGEAVGLQKPGPWISDIQRRLLMRVLVDPNLNNKEALGYLTSLYVQDYRGNNNATTINES